jgi:hypothetical protein
VRDTRRHLAPQNEEAVFHETAAVLLAQEEKSVPDWEIVSPQIAAEIDQQSEQLLDDARADYDAFEKLRPRAVHAYGRVDPAVCGLIGALAGYLFLVIAGPEFLSLAAVYPGLGLTPWILTVLAVALGIRWTLWRRRRTALMRSVPEAYRRWIGVLQDQVLRPFIVERLNDEVRNPRLFDTSIGEKSPPRLIEGSEPRRLVVTEAMTQASVMAQNVHSGSLGVSGPRGVGKSTILQFFGTDAVADDGRDLRLVVPAPVDYEPREFIVHLFCQLCEAVPHGPADRSAIATETRRHLEQLRYLRTFTTIWSASLTPRSFLTLARGYAKERAEQPVTLPELVDSFRGYSGRVASWQRSAHGGEGRVVIGIDEVDKIRDSDRAEAFLNDIKAVFGVPGLSNLAYVRAGDEATCSAKLRITAPAEGAIISNGANGILVQGTACDLGSASRWLFDFDPQDGYYYDDYNGKTPTAVVPSSLRGTWAFDDSPIGDPGDQNKRYVITLVLARPSCDRSLLAEPPIDGDYSVRTLPAGCSIVDQVDVYVAVP